MKQIHEAKPTEQAHLRSLVFRIPEIEFREQLTGDENGNRIERALWPKASNNLWDSTRADDAKARIVKVSQPIVFNSY